jgi:hypothetical protein
MLHTDGSEDIDKEDNNKVGYINKGSKRVFIPFFKINGERTILIFKLRNHYQIRIYREIYR